MTRDAALALVLESIRPFAAELGRPEFGVAGEATPLFGPAGGLDSMALVSLVAELETLVAEQARVEIVLADERAMSRARSPFRTVGSLAEYVAELVNEQAG
jgi:acyl carrier protein